MSMERKSMPSFSAHRETVEWGSCVDAHQHVWREQEEEMLNKMLNRLMGSSDGAFKTSAVRMSQKRSVYFPTSREERIQLATKMEYLMKSSTRMSHWRCFHVVPGYVEFFFLSAAVFYAFLYVARYLILQQTHTLETGNPWRRETTEGTSRCGRFDNRVCSASLCVVQS